MDPEISQCCCLKIGNCVFKGWGYRGTCIRKSTYKLKGKGLRICKNSCMEISLNSVNWKVVQIG